jgi:hypothetical protein
MTWKEMKSCVAFMPKEDPYFETIQGSLNCAESSAVVRSLKFGRAYGDLQFGWNFAKYLSRLHIDFVPSLHEHPILNRAYKLERFGTEDEELEEAVMYTLPSKRYFSDALKSYLLIENITFKEIADRTGVRESVIKLFEKLFFNTLDRRSEALWLANVVYPETRWPEAFDRYTANESFGMLLQRCGYQNGIDDVDFFVGMRKNAKLKDGDMLNAAKKMENMLMINGYLLATNGFVNQRDATGVHSAKTIINAEKHGGNQSEVQDDFTESLSDSIFNRLDDYKEANIDGILTARDTIGEIDSE